jgi:hypothetical protein
MKQPCVSIELSFFTRFMACKIFSLRYFMYGNLMYIIPFFLLCMNSIGIIIHVSSSRSFFKGYVDYKNMNNKQIANNKTLDKRNPLPLTVSCAPSGDQNL